MDIFNFIAGLSSIISLVITIFTLVKVNDIQNFNKTKQVISKSNINDSNVTQVGNDYNDK